MEVFWENLHLQFDAALQGPALLIALAGVGFCIGLLTGLFGVGGGFLITPLLNNLLGVDYSLAVGSSLCFIVGISASGLRLHRRLGNVEPKTIALLACGSIVGTLLGDGIHNWLKHSVASTEQDFNNIMNGLFLGILLLTAWLVWRGPSARHGGKSVLQRLAVPPNITLRAAGLENISLPGMLLVGMGVGVLTGLLGVGGGVLFMPVLLLVVGLQAHQAVGTSLGVVMVSAIVGTVVKGLHGQVSLAIAGSLLITSMVGVQLGAWLCQKLHADKLRKFFALIVLAAALMVLYKLIEAHAGH